VHGQTGMGVGCSGAHFGGYPDCFHYFFFRSTLSKCLRSVRTNTVRTLGNVRYCNGNQLFCFFILSTRLKNSFAKVSPSLNVLWFDRSSFLYQLSYCFREHLIILHAFYNLKLLLLLL